MPRMPFSGVRISWLMLARNCTLRPAGGLRLEQRGLALLRDLRVHEPKREHLLEVSHVGLRAAQDDEEEEPDQRAERQAQVVVDEGHEDRGGQEHGHRDGHEGVPVAVQGEQAHGHDADQEHRDQRLELGLVHREQQRAEEAPDHAGDGRERDEAPQPAARDSLAAGRARRYLRMSR